MAEDKNPSQFQEMGIRKGDVVKTVDGDAVNTPEKAQKLYEATKGSPNLVIGTEKKPPKKK